MSKVQVSYMMISECVHFPLTLAEFPDISRFPEIPEKW